MSGLRERKKQRTRDTLIRAAHERFVTKGYEESTVDEIAAAVDVSQRTFFRYFASKEDVAVALQMLTDEHYLAAVKERPAGESPLEVLRNALDESWEGIGEAIAEIVPMQLYMRMWQVIETTPSLVSAHLRHSMEMEEHLTAVIAAREGLDPGDDPRPRVLVAAFSGVLRAAGHHWGAGEDVTVEAARELVESYVDHLGSALAKNWSTGGGGGAGGKGTSTGSRFRARSRRSEPPLSAKPRR